MKATLVNHKPRKQAVGFVYLALVSLLLGVAACRDTPSGLPEGTRVSLQTASSALPVAGGDILPLARVYDGTGRPVRGVLVRFEVTTGGGRIAMATATTDREGFAAPGAWTLGEALGTNTLSASVDGVSTPARLDVVAVAGTVATLTAAPGNVAEGTVGVALPNPPAVVARDRFGHVVADAAVLFSVDGTSGTLSGAEVRTDAHGVARPGGWTLGTQAGEQRLEARVAAVSVTLAVQAQAGPLAVLRAVAGEEQVGVRGEVATTAPVVRAEDAHGNAKGDVPIAFEVVEGGGWVQHVTAVSDTAGAATAGAWTFGPEIGRQRVRARSADQVATFTAWVAASDTSAIEGLYTLHALAGQDSHCPRTSDDCRFTVEVRDSSGMPAAGVALEWVGADGTTLTSTSDMHGRASARNIGSNGIAGAHVQTVRLPLTRQSLGFRYDLLDAGYKIEVRYMTSVAPEFRAVFERAMARWEEVIIGDLPAVRVVTRDNECHHPAMDEIIDDLLIVAVFDSIDGPGGILGSAGPCLLRTFEMGGLPVAGRVRIDSADARRLYEQGRLEAVILHEIGHVLGIGTLWNDLRVGRGTDDPRFVGAHGTSRFRLAGGMDLSIPVENQGGSGTRDAHWRQSVFGDELMTGWISGTSQPLSDMTIGSLHDLGYRVNVAAADPYFLAGLGLLFGHGHGHGEGIELHAPGSEALRPIPRVVPRQ
jgi:hypothetical protein